MALLKYFAGESLPVKFMPPRTLLEGPQKSSIFFPDPDGSVILSGFTALRMEMASITTCSFTPAGGLFMVFTTVISCVCVRAFEVESV